MKIIIITCLVLCILALIVNITIVFGAFGLPPNPLTYVAIIVCTCSILFSTYVLSTNKF